MSNDYEAETARLFGKFLRRGYVYKGLRPFTGAFTTRLRLPKPKSNTKNTLRRRFIVKFPLKSDAV
jgi:isoleucyl-tRNA synthetase